MDFALKPTDACIIQLNNYVSILVLMDFALKHVRVVYLPTNESTMFQSLF